MPATTPTEIQEFATEKQLDAWLKRHASTAPELWIRIYKVKSGKKTVSPAQAIDVCLTWGWIDAIRKGLDEESFLQRYTPRGKKSVWSQVNVENVARLTAGGRMKPAGIAQVEAAKADGRWDRAYRMKDAAPPPDLVAALDAEPRARAMFDKLSSQNRFAIIFRTLSLKTEAGRKKRIADYVAMLKRGETIHPQKR